MGADWFFERGEEFADGVADAVAGLEIEVEIATGGAADAIVFAVFFRCEERGEDAGLFERFADEGADGVAVLDGAALPIRGVDEYGVVDMRGGFAEAGATRASLTLTSLEIGAMP